MIRSFLAIHPSSETLALLGGFQSEIGETGADVRWVEPSSIHLTIQFLGDVRDSELSGIERSLEQSFRQQPPLEIDCRGMGVFPNLKKPRVVWVGIRSEGLSALADRTEIALAPLGFPPEERAFNPHLTVGRVRSPRGLEPLIALLRESGDRPFGKSRIDRAVLYKSDLRPTGSVYTPIAEIRFLGTE